MMGVSFSGSEIENFGGSKILDKHSKRVNRAANRASTKFFYSRGYVREIFEINFLSSNHLQAPLLGSTVEKYVNSLGRLEKSYLLQDIWEWRLEGEDLLKARTDWEASGLVLSSDCEPLNLR